LITNDLGRVLTPGSMTFTLGTEAKRSRPGPVHHEGQDCHRQPCNRPLNVEASSNVLRTQTRCTAYGANGAKIRNSPRREPRRGGLSSADRIFHAERIALVLFHRIAARVQKPSMPSSRRTKKTRSLCPGQSDQGMTPTLCSLQPLRRRGREIFASGPEQVRTAAEAVSLADGAPHNFAAGQASELLSREFVRCCLSWRSWPIIPGASTSFQGRVHGPWSSRPSSAAEACRRWLRTSCTCCAAGAHCCLSRPRTGRWHRQA
jgi:hypothetical protein